MDENLYFDGWKAGLGEFVEGRGGEWSVAQCTSGEGVVRIIVSWGRCFTGSRNWRWSRWRIVRGCFPMIRLGWDNWCFAAVRERRRRWAWDLAGGIGSGDCCRGDTRSGNAAIDAVFRVRCSDAELARRIFAREEVAGLLLANPWLLLRVETKWGYITVLLKDLIARMYTGEELASFARCVEAVADELLALYYAR